MSRMMGKMITKFDCVVINLERLNYHTKYFNLTVHISSRYLKGEEFEVELDEKRMKISFSFDQQSFRAFIMVVQSDNPIFSRDTDHDVTIFFIGGKGLYMYYLSSIISLSCVHA